MKQKTAIMVDKIEAWLAANGRDLTIENLILAVRELELFEVKRPVA